jgi:predicted metal-dependent HD superfamily phosphohydrolase
MSWPEEERWVTCWQSVGATGDPHGWYAWLVLAYVNRIGTTQWAAHRGVPDGIRPRATSRATTAAVELALSFHDAVVRLQRGAPERQRRKRERRTGGMLSRHARLPNGFIENVRKLVMATKRHEAEPDSDEAVMVDVTSAFWPKRKTALLSTRYRSGRNMGGFRRRFSRQSEWRFWKDFSGGNTFSIRNCSAKNTSEARAATWKHR